MSSSARPRAISLRFLRTVSERASSSLMRAEPANTSRPASTWPRASEIQAPTSKSHTALWRWRSGE